MERIRLNPLGGGGKAPTMPPMPGSQPVHMASRVGSGGMHNYLGHFAQQQFLRAGHNTVKNGSFHGKRKRNYHG